MSIKNIQKLKQFGIFQNHTNTNAKDFGKYNLFYGWNGSGKSTLSGVFRCIEITRLQVNSHLQNSR
nr:AAA family ATPase [Methylophaga muralis]